MAGCTAQSEETTAPATTISEAAFPYTELNESIQSVWNWMYEDWQNASEEEQRIVEGLFISAAHSDPVDTVQEAIAYSFESRPPQYATLGDLLVDVQPDVADVSVAPFVDVTQLTSEDWAAATEEQKHDVALLVTAMTITNADSEDLKVVSDLYEELPNFALEDLLALYTAGSVGQPTESATDSSATSAATTHSPSPTNELLDDDADEDQTDNEEDIDADPEY